MTFSVGEVLEVTVGPVANGGHCVARVGDDPTGRVLFVRHALPGERVQVRITEDSGGSYCRADAIGILTESPDRLKPACAHAGPGLCGGCDWQHVSPHTQRLHKAEVITDLFSRLARLAVRVEVEELPGGALGWRTRTIYAVSPEHQLGLRRHRSHDVEVLTECPLGTAAVGDLLAIGTPGPRADAIEVLTDSAGGRTLLEHRVKRTVLSSGPGSLQYEVLGKKFKVRAGGFWQVHPYAAPIFTSAVLAATEPRPGETVLDLYAGAGLFTAFLADKVGPGGKAIGIEGDRYAVRDAVANLALTPWASSVHASVTADSIARHGANADVVVLDPPRSGAGRGVMKAVLALSPRVVAYLSCDPATLARDVATAVESGWNLAQLRAFDAFPMTHHVECLAILTREIKTSDGSA